MSSVQPLSPNFSAALDAFFEWYYRAHPVNATFIGVHHHDARLPDFSEEASGDVLDEIEALRARFRALPQEPLTESERLDRALAEGYLEIQRWERASGHFHLGNPCVYTGEAAFGVMALFLRPFAPLATRVEAAVERMRAIPLFLAQGRRNIRRAPQAWIERAIRECAGALAFFDHGIDVLIREGVAHPRFRDAADKAAAAFREFQAYLEADLLPGATDGYACGGEGLELLLRRGHFLEMDAEAVAALGQEEMEVALTRLREGAAALGVREWRDALSQLSDHHPPAASYYARYAEVWQEARAAAEAYRLVSWPDYPIRYVPQPKWAREAAPNLYFLFYRAPAAFDRVPTVDYLVAPVEPEMAPEEQTRRLRATNDSVIKLNHVVHHGGLGHHVQNWNAYNRAGSRIGQVAAVDCAGRIAMYCGGTMAEGWACYATDLMEEIGFLTPLERMAQAYTRLRMTARAVVDVRLHTGAWTLEEAAACYRDRVAMSPEAARAEAVKNSMFPGTALMYLTGTERIHQLRRHASREKGFELRTFHDRFLSYGSVPVALIATAMAGEPG